MGGRIVPLIMCGGAGTRLWPASREVRPKQFLPLFGARSTFQDTILRVSEPALFDRFGAVGDHQQKELRLVGAVPAEEVGPCSEAGYVADTVW